MLTKTNKTKGLVIKVSGLLACLLISTITLLPSVAFAASQVYAVACNGTDVVISGNVVNCGTSPSVLRLYGIGSAKKPYPQGDGIAVVTVDCGRSSPVTPLINGPVDFKCHNGSHPTIKQPNTLQHGTPVAAGTVCNTKTDATCSVCNDPTIPAKYKDSCVDCQNGVCSDAAANPNATCDGSDGCDLIQKYVNPLINLFSMVFGLIAVISIIIGGIQYASSTGDPQKVSAAKQRIVNTMIAIFAYFILYGFLQFLVPGGIFNK